MREMDFKEFLTYFSEFRKRGPGGADFRPALSQVVRDFVLGNKEAHNSALGPYGYVISEAERKTGFWKPPQRIRTRNRQSPSDDTPSRDFEAEVKAWGRNPATARGDKVRAIAVLYWFFRYVPEPSHFSEIARYAWDHGSQTFKRFIYAKLGGELTDTFRIICARFHTDMEVIDEAFSRLWRGEKPPFDLTLPTRSSQIYHYTSNALEILGRKDAQDALKRFRDGGPGFRWWQISGAAGQGKSRLALDLVEKTHKELPNWRAGFLASDEALEDFAKACATWMPDQEHLIVIDYLLARTDTLKRAVQALKTRANSFKKAVCLLLVERQPWNIGGFGALDGGRADWFCNIAGNTSGEDTDLDGLRFRDQEDSEYQTSIELGPLSPGQLADIVTSVAAEEKNLIPESRETIQEMLAEIDDEGRPLYAYFLAKALGAGAPAAAKDAESLLEWVLQTDRRRRWVAVFQDTPVPGVGSEAPAIPGYPGHNPAMHLALLATITGEIDCNYIPRDLGWAPHNAEILRQALVITDRPLADDPEALIVGLQPDLLGEWFVLRSMEKQRAFLDVFDLAWVLAPEKTAEFLTRFSRDFAAHPATTALLDRLPTKEDADARTAYGAATSGILVNLHRQCAALPNGLMAMLEHAANGGNGRAMANLGVCYYNGTGVEQNIEKALEWYRKGAAAGEGHAMAFFGLCHENSEGVNQNIETALAWYRKGVAAGDGHAMAFLGLCYELGKGVEQKVEMALELYRKGAAAGVGLAMAFLGLRYECGKSVEQNIESALEWYRKGAAAGDGRAMAFLGLCYERGKGLEQNIETALEWYRIGAAVGDGFAKENYARLSTMMEEKRSNDA